MPLLPAKAAYMQPQPEVAGINQLHASAYVFPNISPTDQPENAQKFFNSAEGCLHLS